MFFSFLRPFSKLPLTWLAISQDTDFAAAPEFLGFTLVVNKIRTHVAIVTQVSRERLPRALVLEQILKPLADVAQ